MTSAFGILLALMLLGAISDEYHGNHQRRCAASTFAHVALAFDIHISISPSTRFQTGATDPSIPTSRDRRSIAPQHQRPKTKLSNPAAPQCATLQPPIHKPHADNQPQSRPHQKQHDMLFEPKPQPITSSEDFTNLRSLALASPVHFHLLHRTAL
jgi:hypothetical protein